MKSRASVLVSTVLAFLGFFVLLYHWYLSSYPQMAEELNHEQMEFPQYPLVLLIISTPTNIYKINFFPQSSTMRSSTVSCVRRTVQLGQQDLNKSPPMRPRRTLMTRIPLFDAYS